MLKIDRKRLNFLFPFLIGIFLWSCPSPEGLSFKAWHLFSIFVATVVGVILKPIPMGAVTLLGLTFAAATQTLTLTETLSGFSNDIVWLVLFAFFISRGFIATGLGSRIAYGTMRLCGKSSLGLGYGLILTDLILAPTIPSVTARVGGVIYPILKSVADIFTGPSHDPKMGAFLAQTAFQGAMITSAMFLTAMAGNPLILELVHGQGIAMSWGSWALAALVPGLASLLLLPYFLFRFSPPVIQKTPHAKQMATDRLRALGPMKKEEWVMLFTFALLIVLWVLGEKIGVKATVAAMIGVSILFVTGILQWKDVLDEKGAWDTFIWFAGLVTLATSLYHLGVGSWWSEFVAFHIGSMNWVAGFFLVTLIYFYSHYFFASCVAHIGAMYVPFLIVLIAIGAPPELAALTLAFFSNLMGGLTHYGSGPAPILFGAGYMSTRQWWKMGFFVSLCNIAIWMILGSLWWKLLGLW